MTPFFTSWAEDQTEVQQVLLDGDQVGLEHGQGRHEGVQVRVVDLVVVLVLVGS